MSSSAAYSSTRRQFVGSLKRIAASIENDGVDFVSELAVRFRKRTKQSPSDAAKKKSRRGPKTVVLKCRLTCLADCKVTNIRNLGSILSQLNSSSLGRILLRSVLPKIIILYFILS